MHVYAFCLCILYIIHQGINNCLTMLITLCLMLRWILRSLPRGHVEGLLILNQKSSLLPSSDFMETLRTKNNTLVCQILFINITVKIISSSHLPHASSLIWPYLIASFILSHNHSWLMTHYCLKWPILAGSYILTSRNYFVFLDFMSLESKVLSIASGTPGRCGTLTLQSRLYRPGKGTLRNGHSGETQWTNI